MIEKRSKRDIPTDQIYGGEIFLRDGKPKREAEGRVGGRKGEVK